ncbi:glycosyltransferase [Asaia bogorensis]|uniref:glycosyltransferase n=1 Tax=Asaia bogorensis TaxID=91915 RepID=UPI00285B4BFE|nr:glycosyltransferase [Asaia bogorensis]MDR6181433.1 glycosyltransferase involved in cell wall biosynthesis [Asaia bogorensis NBRC 16594]
MSVTLPIRPPAAQQPLSRIGIVLRDFRLGGSERVAIGLANFWASCGLEVVIMAGRGTGPLRALVARGVAIVDFAITARLNDTALVWMLAWRARHRAAGFAFDAVYIPGNSHWPVVPLLATLTREKRPFILAQVSSPVCREGRSPAAQSRYDRRMRTLLRHADRVTTLSHDLAQQTREILRGTPVDVVPLPALWDEAPPSPVPADSKTILAAGRLTAIKGFDGLIRAFRLVLVGHPQAKLVICGEGEARAELETLIEQLDLSDRVSLCGYVPSIREALTESRVFALTSHCESFGAVLIEALAAGRQVVATDCSPAVGTFITSRSAGRIVPTRDEVALANALADVLDEAPTQPADLTPLVDRFHVSHGGRLFLTLMQPRQTITPGLAGQGFDKTARA